MNHHIPFFELTLFIMKEYNLRSLVVSRFKEITISDAIMNGCLDSTSFKNGLFENTIEYIDFLIGDGNVIRVDR